MLAEDNIRQELNDSSINDTLENIKYKETILKNVEIMKQAFKKIDINSDNQISYVELAEFLDNNSKNGKVFDRGILNTIFREIDTDNTGYITVNEFIRSFLYTQEELKFKQKTLNREIISQRSEMNNFQQLKLRANNENLNAEGVSENANLNIEIISLEQLDKTFPSKLLSVKLVYRNLQSATMRRNPYNLNFNEKFDFPLNTRNDGITIQVINHDNNQIENLVGYVKIPFFNFFDNTNENYLNYEISNEKNKKVFNLNIKLHFIWSNFRYYSECYEKSLATYNSTLESIKKINSLLETMNDPFKFLTGLGSNQQGSSDSTRNQFNPRDPFYGETADGNAQCGIFKLDFLDEYLKNSTENSDSQISLLKRLNFINVMKFALLICLKITFFNLIAKSDFLSLLIYCFIFVVLSTTYKKDKRSNIKYFIFSLLFSVLFDVVWICLHFNENNPTPQLKSINSIVFLNSNVTVFIKIFLLFMCSIEKEKINNLEAKDIDMNNANAQG